MWTFFIILASLVVGIFVGHMYGANIMTHIATALGRPYHRTTITRGKEVGTSNIDAEFNSLFIYEVERQYDSNPTTKGVIDKMAPDNEKVAIYLYDMLANLAEPYLPAEPQVGDDIGADIPALGFRGGEEVRQVVDLADASKKAGIDFVE